MKPARYLVQLQWGGSDAPWQPGGYWTFPAPLVNLSVTGSGNGETLAGTVQYAQGSSQQVTANWNAEHKVYGVSVGDALVTSPLWYFAGNQILMAGLDSTESGTSITGQCQFPGQGPIGVQGSLES